MKLQPRTILSIGTADISSAPTAVQQLPPAIKIGGIPRVIGEAGIKAVSGKVTVSFGPARDGDASNFSSPGIQTKPISLSADVIRQLCMRMLTRTDAREWIEFLLRIGLLVLFPPHQTPTKARKPRVSKLNHSTQPELLLNLKYILLYLNNKSPVRVCFVVCLFFVFFFMTSLGYTFSYINIPSRYFLVIYTFPQTKLFLFASFTAI